MLGQVLTQVAIIVSVLLVVSTVVFIGRERLVATRAQWRSRLREAAPIGVVLGSVLLFNRIARQEMPVFSRDLNWIIDQVTPWGEVRMTDPFYAIEADLIIWFQQHATAELTAYFSFIYVYAYAFMLVFPVVAYFALSNTRYLRELLVAYTLNYSIGLVFYALVIAYGPRNLMIDIFEPTNAMLYDTNPQYQYLTGEVNRPTNVFPSLHTSLAATVAAFAYRTREFYALWFPVAVALAVSVAVSTMYLGIHWASDVVAGLVLAYASVAASKRLVGRWSLSERAEGWLEGRLPFRD